LESKPEIETVQNWEQLLKWKPQYPDIIMRLLRTLTRLVIHSHPTEDDAVGHLIVAFISTSLPDINDIMTLTHYDSHHGAHKILRPLFERTVTLKYIVDNPSEAERFLGFQAIDWEQVIVGIETLTGISMEETGRTNLRNAAQKARQEYKQTRCEVCGFTKPTSWSKLNAKDMAFLVGMGHMHLHSFLVASKLIHPSFWGMRETVGDSSPMYNTLNCVHELMVHLLLMHRRHFMTSKAIPLPPTVKAALGDFLNVWVIAQTSFGGALREIQPGTFVGYPRRAPDNVEGETPA
jgi:hypothetical protein